MSDLAGPFEVIVNDALRSGNALLLIDGLDEISEEGSRVSFVHQLRTFLATYPSVDVVVTSREAGFRVVGGALASQCKHYRVSDLDDEDITRLTLAWHREVIGDRASVRDDAEQLAQTILDSDRIRQLAQNSLLLTTLLLVNRWVGRIPTRRSVLYGKAIELLLMTWNVEGTTPVDLEEAIPQLAFIAFTMMRDGEQQISLRRLREVLLLAREQMPEVLGYAKLSVPDFINRVELRSSLLVLGGHEVEQGTLTAFYEFKHLTFQEYLAALAIAEGYYPDRNDADTLLTVLQPFLKEEAWKEVIPLVAVLSGRKAQPLVRHLIDLCQQSPSRPVRREGQYPVDLLGQCILDEIQIPPNLLEEALESIGRRIRPQQENLTADLFKGRHGELFDRLIRNAYLKFDGDLLALGHTLPYITSEKMNLSWSESIEKFFDPIAGLLIDEDPVQVAAGSLATMEFAFMQWVKSPEGASLRRFEDLGDRLIPALYAKEGAVHFSACWALVWLGRSNLWTPERQPTVLPRLFDLWMKAELPELQYVVTWAISELPIIDRELVPMPDSHSKLAEFIKRQAQSDESGGTNTLSRTIQPRRYIKSAAYVASYYLKAPWTDEDLATLVEQVASGWRKRESLLHMFGRSA